MPVELIARILVGKSSMFRKPVRLFEALLAVYLQSSERLHRKLLQVSDCAAVDF